MEELYQRSSRARRLPSHVSPPSRSAPETADLEFRIATGWRGRLSERPALLVSVRNVEEALEALRGGAEILDVKEPGRGTLGRPDDEVIDGVAALARGLRVPVTAALGELLEAPGPRGFIPASGVALHKLGLAGCGGSGEWMRRLDGWAERLTGESGRIRLAAAVYADHRSAGSPEPREVLDYAASRRLPFILIDTFRKDSGSLRHLLEDAAIGRLVDAAHAGGVRCALAGSLRAEDLEPLSALGPDVIAVRGAACAGSDRRADVDRARVADLEARLCLTAGARTLHPASSACDGQGRQGPRRG